MTGRYLARVAPFMRFVLIGFILAFIAGVSPAHAKGGEGEKPRSIGFNCDKGLAPQGGKCVKCGHKAGQPACEPMRRGPQCYRYMENVNGTCRARGGNNQDPYSGAGFDCKPGYNVGANGKCTPCGDNNEVECEAMRPGPQCNGDLNNDGGICTNRGLEGGEPWPAIRPGFRCESGTTAYQGPDEDMETCQACGDTGQPACHAMRKGHRCTAAYHQPDSDDICEARGGQDQPAMTGPGFECRPGFNWVKNDAGDKICTRCGGLNQVNCEVMREGDACGANLVLETLSRKCVESPNYVENPFFVLNKTSSTVYVSIHWAVDAENLWILDEGEVPANGRKEFHIAGQYTCNPRKGEDVGGGTDWGFSDLFDFKDPVDTCEGQHFQVMFWDSKSDRTKWALEQVAVGTVFYFASDFALGKLTEPVTGGILPVPGADEIGLFALELWNDMRDPSGTLAGYGVHAWAWNVPQEDGWVVYWGKDALPDYGFTTSSTPDYANLVHPCERSSNGYSWATAVDSEGRVEDGKTIHVTGMCDDYSAQSSTATRSLDLSSQSGDARMAADTGGAADAVSNAGGLDVTGSWKMNTGAVEVALAVVSQSATSIAVKQGGGGPVINYQQIAENEYRAQSGAMLKFVSATRGIWISADKSKVYQVQR